jgi:hypothetical protein
MVLIYSLNKRKVEKYILSFKSFEPYIFQKNMFYVKEKYTFI